MFVINKILFCCVVMFVQNFKREVNCFDNFVCANSTEILCP